jgi:peptide chain release factor 2
VITFDPAALELRLAELEQALNEPGFWSDQERAQKISTEHSRVAKRLSMYARLSAEYEDAASLLELDPEMAAEIEASIIPLRHELGLLQEAALFDGEYDAGDAVVTLQSGTGGTDAQDWAEMMLRMYERWAAERGFNVALLEASPGEEAGLKSATFTIGGENAYGILKAERGKHRLVRQSPFDSAHRRHTAFATVIVAPLLPVGAEIEIEDDDLKIDTYRASGAGGQHVNKTDSAIRITHLPTGLVVECQDERSQHKNRSRAMALMKAKLLAAEQEKRDSEVARDRKLQVGTGDRSERIRTYNFPQGRVTDHRINLTLYKIERIMDGDLDELIAALTAEHQTEQLAQLAEETQPA